MASISRTLKAAVITESAWRAALARLNEASAQFEVVRVELNQAERVYFGIRNEDPGDASVAELAARARVDRAYEQEAIFIDALFEAAKAFYLTPSPNLPCAIRKIELIEQHGYDGNVEPLILADLRGLLRED